MRRVLLGAAIAALCLAPAQAGDFSIFGAYQVARDLDNSYGAGVKLGGAFGESNWDFDVRATYLGEIGSDIGGFDFDVRVIPVELGVSYNFSKDSPTNFYIGGGGAYYFLHTDEGQLDDEIGWYADLGFETGTDKTGVGFFVEGIYRLSQATVEGVQEPGNPNVVSDVDIELDGAGLNAGVVWRW